MNGYPYTEVAAELQSRTDLAVFQSTEYESDASALIQQAFHEILAEAAKRESVSTAYLFGKAVILASDFENIRKHEAEMMK